MPFRSTKHVLIACVRVHNVSEWNVDTYCSSKKHIIFHYVWNADIQLLVARTRISKHVLSMNQRCTICNREMYSNIAVVRSIMAEQRGWPLTHGAQSRHSIHVTNGQIVQCRNKHSKYQIICNDIVQLTWRCMCICAKICTIYFVFRCVNTRPKICWCHYNSNNALLSQHILSPLDLAVIGVMLNDSHDNSTPHYMVAGSQKFGRDPQLHTIAAACFYASMTAPAVAMVCNACIYI